MQDIWSRILNLAQMELPSKEKDLILPQVKKTIDFFNQISKVDTRNQAALISPIEEEKGQALREDQVQKTSPPNLQTADGNFIKAPLILKDE